jgi:hypothetical protein
VIEKGDKFPQKCSTRPVKYHTFPVLSFPKVLTELYKKTTEQYVENNTHRCTNL